MNIKEKNRKKENNIRQNLAKQYKDKIAKLEKENLLLNTTVNEYKNRIDVLSKENEELKYVLSELQSLKKLSDEEIKILIQNAQHKEKLLKFFRLNDHISKTYSSIM